MESPDPVTCARSTRLRERAKMIRRSLLCAGLLSISQLAGAAEDMSWEFGAGIGRSIAEIGDVDFKGTALDLFAGYHFNRYFNAEVGFMSVQDATETLQEVVRVDFDATAAHASITGSYPFNEIFSAFGRIGVAYWDSELEYSVDGPTLVSVKDNGADPLYGVGVSATMFEDMQLRLQYMLSKPDAADVNVISFHVLGLLK
jgi:hypothetical protein